MTLAWLNSLANLKLLEETGSKTRRITCCVKNNFYRTNLTELPTKKMEKNDEETNISPLDVSVRKILQSKSAILLSEVSSPEDTPKMVELFRCYVVFYQYDTRTCAHFYLQLREATLDRIDFSELPITIELLNEFLEQHPNLKEINISDCPKLDKFASSISGSTAQKNLGKFQALIARNKCLTSLHLDYNFAKKMIWFLYGLKLEKLSIRKNGADLTPESFLEQSQLTFIDKVQKLYSSVFGEKEDSSELPILEDGEIDDSTKATAMNMKQKVRQAIESNSPSFPKSLVEELSPELTQELLIQFRLYAMAQKLNSEKCDNFYRQLRSTTLDKIDISGLPVTMRTLVCLLWQHPNLREIKISGCPEIRSYVRSHSGRQACWLSRFRAAIARNKCLSLLHLDYRLAREMIGFLRGLGIEKILIRKNGIDLRPS